MKRILIGVLFVVAIAAIGLGITSLVYGQFGVEPELPTVTTAETNPTSDPTGMAIVDEIFSGVAPTPVAECKTQIVDLSDNSIMVIDETSSIWFSIDAEENDMRSILGPYIVDTVEVHGNIIQGGYALTNYVMYKLSIDTVTSNPLAGEFSIPPGDYTLSAQQVVKDSFPNADLIYTIYICPPIGN